MVGTNLKREIDQVAKDKGIDPGEITGALEEAMRQAARKRFGQDKEIEARYNDEIGEVELFEFREVVDTITDPETQTRLEALLKEHGLSGETLLYRETLPEFLSAIAESGGLQVSANDDAAEALLNVYGDGHIWNAHQIGPGLALTETKDNEWSSEDRKSICVRLQDVLEQGGLVYPVESVITDRAWYVTLPSGSLYVHEV